MNLNRNNYEEFFLLYVDNELSAAERRALEAFVAIHPDLKEELELLMEMRCSPDETAFTDKASLLRFTEEEPAFITSENIQYWMLMKIDGELNRSKEKELERFLQEQPAYQKEFSALQKTKLQPDLSIIFSDKKSLYRKEETVFRISWQRVAIAAAILLFVSLTIIFQLNSNNQHTETVQQSSGPAKTNNGTDVQKSSLKENRNTGKEVVATNDQTGAIKKNSTIQKNQPGYSHDNKTVIKKEVPAPDNIAKQAVNRKNPDNKQPQTNEIPQQVQNFAVLNNTTINNKNESPVKQIEPTMKELLNKAAYSTEPVVANNNNATENTPVVFTPEENIRSSSSKKGLRGFFRKVGRTLSRSTGIGGSDDRENKVLIGGLAIAK